jgi:energy-coupling factor transport system permease protein
MDVAATLELRGFATRRPRSIRALFARGWSRGHDSYAKRHSGAYHQRARLGRFSRHDLAFASSAGAILALSLGGRLGGLASFHAYPLLHAPVSAGTLALSLALALVVLLPFCDRRGVQQ